jgi:UDPglucose--hexose-1-phosphate uridylyltransferase
MPIRPSIKRWNPLQGEWVIIAPSTAGRPWSGTIIPSNRDELPDFDPGCYLCPGVRRAGGEKNPEYKQVYVFDNDFPSLSMEYKVSGNDVPAAGICRVVCFSPRHNISLPLMSSTDVHAVVLAFRDQYRELSSIPGIENVMMFENRGKVIGVSNPHPHGQIYCTDFVPRIPLTRYQNAKKYFDDKGICLFCSIFEQELKRGILIISENDHFAAFVPPYARFAYEVHIYPRRHVSSITDLSQDELFSLTKIYREILIRYDNLFMMPFPNITIFQNCPCSPELDPRPYHFHMEFLPPMRSPDKLKYLAGFESGGGNIVNPALPEESADELKKLSTIHYLENEKGRE